MRQGRNSVAPTLGPNGRGKTRKRKFGLDWYETARKYSSLAALQGQVNTFSGLYHSGVPFGRPE